MSPLCLSKILRSASVILLVVLSVLLNEAHAERWTDTVTRAEEPLLARTLIRAIRAENWLEAVEIADRYRGSPASGFSQYQAFAYVMTGRLDLVSAFQREGRIPVAEVCEEVPGLELRIAVDTILDAAANHRAIVIQEFHWDAQQRYILHALLPQLREIGYTYFAAEDFEGTPEAYETVKYPREAQGFHSTREPVFADAVRTAIRLGYQLVPYEASLSPDLRPQEIRRQRVEQQAHNLYRRIFASAPEAKAIIYADFGFAREMSNPDVPTDVPMLVRFKQLSGIDPLTIDQTICRHRTRPGRCATTTRVIGI